MSLTGFSSLRCPSLALQRLVPTAYLPFPATARLRQCLQQDWTHEQNCAVLFQVRASAWLAVQARGLLINPGVRPLQGESFSAA